MRLIIAALTFSIALAFWTEPINIVSEIHPVLASSGSQSGTSNPVIIPVDRSRSKSDIVEMARQLPHSGFTYGKTTQYDNPPSLTAPYTTGSLKPGELEDALNAIKMIRYIAGLPYENIKLDPGLNNIAQHGAVLLAATGQFTHNPTNPGDMSGDFFSLGYNGCSASNLYKGTVNISRAVLGFMSDPGSLNITSAAHRRWVLRPGTVNFGIGYAEKITSMYVYNSSETVSYEADTYIAWPNSGDFPIEYFLASADISSAPQYPWSVNLGAEYSVPAREKVSITLTRTRDNKVWFFDKSTPQLGDGYMPDSSMHFSVDNTGYGIGKAIIFRPDVTSLGPILDGDEFTVLIKGIETSSGEPAELCFSINFFSLLSEMVKAPAEEYEYVKGELARAACISGSTLTAVPCYSGNSVVKMSAVIGGSVVFIAPESALYRVRHNEKSFGDISGHWSKDNIEFVTARELFLGTGGSLFEPDGTMTRAMFVTALARLSGNGTGACESVFSDVGPEDWFGSAVMWAYDNGIVNGVGGGCFSPNSPVTREQMAAILVRYCSYAGFTLTPAAERQYFYDSGDIDEWCFEAVYTLQRAGIVGGKPGNVFDPAGFSTRAEISAVFKRLIESILNAA